MVSTFQNLKKAREMRLSGKSYSEIRKEVNISLGTLSNWLKDIVLSETQLIELNVRVKPKMNRGRLNALIIRKSARIYKEKKIYEEASRDFHYLIKDPIFTAGLVLYWSNGTKGGNVFQFSNSDQNLVNFMTMWIIKYVKVDKNLIKNRNYNGYTRLLVCNIDVLRRVMAWQKLLIQYYDSILSV